MCLMCTAVGQGRRLSPFLGEGILLFNNVAFSCCFFFCSFTRVWEETQDNFSEQELSVNSTGYRSEKAYLVHDFVFAY